jgi:hypothetical protein
MPVYRDPTDKNLYHVNKVQTCSGRPLEVTTVSGYPVSITSAGTTAGDAFGRLRVSQPYTLFDSQHRYQENDKWTTVTGGSATTVFNPNESTLSLNVTTASGDYIYRETKRVFPYQPGKSLLVLNSFTFASGIANRRQRVGYFSTQNGVFLEQSGTTNYLVLRSYVSGSVNETRVEQSEWNTDKFDGTGTSARTLDPTKGNILWMDIEWLGVGDVRTGFIVDGSMVVAHTFHNENVQNTTYMTTAVLPLRQEIQNLGTTSTSGTARQICNTVASEGGYEGFTRRYNIATSTTPKTLTSSGVTYPLVSIRMASGRTDSVIVPANLSVALEQTQNNKPDIIQYRVLLNPTLSGANWQTHYNGNVQFDTTATGVSGGTDIIGGYIVSDGTLSLSDVRDFNFQLGRTQAGVSDIFTVVAAPTISGAKVFADLSWFEIV